MLILLQQCLYLYDLNDHHNVYINRSVGELLGYCPEWVVEMGPSFTAAVMHPSDFARLPQHLLQFQTSPTTETLNFEYRMRHQQGHWRWFWSQDTVFQRSPDGTPQQILGTAIDISDRKQIEQDRERFLSVGTDLQVITGINGYFHWVSPTFEQTLGWTPTEMTSGFWTEFVHPDDIQTSVAEATSVFSDKETHTFENRYRHKDGSYRWLLWNARSYPEEQVIYGAAVDITEHKQAEAEREQLLEREQSARQAAETANRIKDQFLAVLSHELRTPLNPILGWTKLLKKGLLNSKKADEALATIERNAHLQAQLIEDLLDISRILQGKLALNINSVDLRYVVSMAQETVRLAADAKRIELQTTIEPGVGKVAGDVTRLQQVLWNLLSNAIKFTPQGGRVEIRLAQVDNQVQIQVQDTGKGISAEFLPLVFDYFRQADGATTRQFGGLGLGLAIVRQIVELHGGTVEADSLGEGQGATFGVRLPVGATNPAACPAFVPIAASGLRGMEILVVDDEVDSRTLAAYVLEDAGATVMSVESAIEALKLFSQRKFDLLVSDIGMPEMDGYLLIRQLRLLSFEQNAQIPAIALTAYATETDQHHILQAGFQSHVTKPLDPVQLVTIAASLVEKQFKV
ncbi:MAG: PAS domain-containing protein [Leptolyngbyaceae cyanobacterium CSU_1_4]|nr:PAS domain-containing protein [Leptolyngbyaceae cyanobacterium CSU_1_4]